MVTRVPPSRGAGPLVVRCGREKETGMIAGKERLRGRDEPSGNHSLSSNQLRLFLETSVSFQCPCCHPGNDVLPATQQGEGRGVSPHLRPSQWQIGVIRTRPPSSRKADTAGLMSAPTGTASLAPGRHCGCVGHFKPAPVTPHLKPFNNRPRHLLRRKATS